MPGPNPHLLQRWGSLAFGDYVKGLQHQADAALAAASPQERCVGGGSSRAAGGGGLLACRCPPQKRRFGLAAPELLPLPPLCREEAEALFVRVCRLENEFWSMAFAADD